MEHTARIALATWGHHLLPSNLRRIRLGQHLEGETLTHTVSNVPPWRITQQHWSLAETWNSVLFIYSTAYTPPVNSLDSKIHSPWAAAASEPSKECMVTVSTLERQHMASWSDTAASNRASLSRGSYKRPDTDPSHTAHSPSNRREKRDYCKDLSSWWEISARAPAVYMKSF